MSVSVVESVQTGILTGPVTVSLATTPQPGDVVLVAYRCHRTSLVRYISGITGLGATWAAGYAPGSQGSLWVGTGATASGNITITQNSSWAMSVAVYLVRGLTSATVVGAAADGYGAGPSVEYGPTLSAGNGQFVVSWMFNLAAAGSLGTIDYPASRTPGADWTDVRFVTNGSTDAYGDAYRIPTGESAAHRYTARHSNDTTPGSNWLAVVGTYEPPTTPPPGVSGTLAGTGPAPTAALTGTAVTPVAPVTGALAATGPAPRVAMSGTVAGPTTGALAAVGPAPTASLSGTVTGSGAVVLDGWGRDLSQRALVRIVPGTAVLNVAPALAIAPATVTERPLRRVSHVMPTLAPDADGRVRADGTHTIDEEDFGVPHLFIGNRDVTYYGGVPVQIGEWRSSEPGGDEYVSLTFPQLTAFDTPGEGDLDWLKADSPVDIVIVKADGTRVHQFAGYLVSNTNEIREDSQSVVWQAEGVLKQPEYFGHRVPTILEPTDIGTMIAKHLNGVISRKYAPVQPVTTGILTRKRGSYTDSEWDYVQELLATSWTEDGGQWTVARTGTPRAFRIQQKDTDTTHWTLTTGAPGVEVNLSADQTQVVDAIYGRGVGPDGYSWAGWVYPNLLADAAPAYPYSSAGTVMTVGSTDAGTLTGNGVSAWQERARQLGMTITVDGVYSASDADVAREIQRRNGLSVDGVVGPQTWNATFGVGSNAGSLDGAYRRPLVVNPEFEPYLYNADGSIAGNNPAYDPTRLRHEREVDYGPGVTKAEAARSARIEMDRDSAPRKWAGTITLTTDPHEGSRFEMFEGQNVTLLGWRNYGTLQLHIADVAKQLDPPQVTLTVDTHAQDAMTLSAILERDRAAKTDPARRPGSLTRRSRMEQDAVVEFDGESGAGVIPRHALYGGLWTVIRIPVSQVGRVAKLDLRTTGPASKFAVALFGAPIQPAHLAAYVGNPLASDSPFEAYADTLIDKFGFIEGWGQSGQACGYWPGSEGEGGSVTGRHVDTGGFEYVSVKPPWVWVAEYSPVSTFIQGRIYPAPVQ